MTTKTEKTPNTFDGTAYQPYSLSKDSAGKLAFLKQIAKALGEPWTVEGTGYPFYFVDGATFKIKVEIDVSYRGERPSARVEVHGKNIPLDYGSVRIAKAINRLLPEILQEKAIDAKRQRERKERERKQAVALKTAIGEWDSLFTPADQTFDRNRRFFHGSALHGAVRAEAGNPDPAQSVTISLHLSPEAANKVVAVLAQYASEQASAVAYVLGARPDESNTVAA
jgi:hypothetical protein